MSHVQDRNVSSAKPLLLRCAAKVSSPIAARRLLRDKPAGAVANLGAAAETRTLLLDAKKGSAQDTTPGASADGSRLQQQLLPTSATPDGQNSDKPAATLHECNFEAHSKPALPSSVNSFSDGDAAASRLEAALFSSTSSCSSFASGVSTGSDSSSTYHSTKSSGETCLLVNQPPPCTTGACEGRQQDEVSEFAVPDAIRVPSHKSCAMADVECNRGRPLSRSLRSSRNSIFPSQSSFQSLKSDCDHSPVLQSPFGSPDLQSNGSGALQQHFRDCSPSSMQPALSPESSQDYVTLFNAFDADSDGFLSFMETCCMLQLLSPGIPLTTARAAAVEALLRYDEDGDGQLSCVEFTVLINRQVKRLYMST